MPLYENTSAEGDTKSEHTYETTTDAMEGDRNSYEQPLPEYNAHEALPESVYIEPEPCRFRHGPEFGIAATRGREGLKILRKPRTLKQRFTVWITLLTVLVILSIGANIASILLWLKAAGRSIDGKRDLLKIEEEIFHLRSELEQLETNKTVEFKTSLEVYGWYQAENGYWYKLFNAKLNYGEAKENCKALGTRLASTGIRDIRMKNAILKRLAKEESWHIWIGLDDLQWQHAWVWSDGTPSTVNNTQWKVGEPSNDNGNQRCGHLFASKTWPLNDKECGRAYRYLCETKVQV